MESLGLIQKYDDYQKTHIHSVENIPCGWNILRFHDVFSFSKGLNITKENLQEDGIPCLNYGEIHSKFGFELRPEIHSLKCVDEKYLKNNKKSILRFGDFIFADTSEDYEGAGNFTYLNSEDEIFAGYHTLICRLKIGVNERYLAYVVDSEAFRLQVRRAVKGVKVFSITQGLLKGTKLWLASEEEQTRIANFLDKKTAQIDEAIAIKEQQISLLKERKQIIIQQAVTLGLDPNVPMKDSGVDWIGKIPAHWGIESFKNVLTERNEKNDPIKSRERLSLSIDKGITLYAEKTTNLDRFKDDFKQYKLAHESDLVFNSMNMIVGAVGVSNYFGCVSPVYYTYYSRNENSKITKYYESLFRSRIVQSQLFCLGKGIMAIDRGDGKFNTVRLKVSRDDLRSMKVPCPTNREIIEIVEHIEAINVETGKAIDLNEQQIEKLKEYKTTLINSAVTGKIKITPEMVEQ